MSRLLPRLLLALAACALVLGACSSDDDDLSASDADREEAIELFESVGFAGDAECIVESLHDQGVDISDLTATALNTPGRVLKESVGFASFYCQGGLEFGDGSLGDPAFHDDFVQGLAQTSGLPVEISECVADYLRDNDIDTTSLADPDSKSTWLDAFESCKSSQ